MSVPKVLFVTGEYPPLPGGIGDYTANLRMALAAMGGRSVVLSGPGASGEDVATVRRWSWGVAAQVRRIVAREQVDIVHIQYQAGAFAMHPVVNLLPSLLLRRLPVVTTFHDLRVPYLFPKAGRLRKSAIVRMARGSAAVIVTNPADSRALANEGIATMQIPIGPNLPPPGPIDAIDRSTVAFFGFPSRSKGILDLLDAISRLPDPRPSLTLVGAQGEPSAANDIVGVSEIDSLAAQHAISVRRTGFLDPRRASDALAAAGAIVLPFRDGASLRSGSLLAALQSGRPVVTTAPRVTSDLGDLAGLPQLLLVAAGEPAAFASAIERTLASTSQPAPLPPTFRWQSIATAHDALYRRLLNERRR
jgi:glycosyltransferase involved in cell wall biosynthesis